MMLSTIINRRLGASMLIPFRIGLRLATTHRHNHQSVLNQIHPKHLYQIINNVDEYQNFLPYCKESKILQVSSCKTMMDAVLRVGLPFGSSKSLASMEERYVSRVRMIPPSPDEAMTNKQQVWIVEAKSIQSKLFDSLKSRWRLSLASCEQPTDVSCNVSFDVEITISNPVISFALDKVLKDVADTQVQAFEKRCRNVSYAR